jgi:hypothetical protein
MENKRSESDTDNGETSTFSLDSRSMSPVRIITNAESSPGSVVQPLNPHYSGYDVVVAVPNENPEIEWNPGSGYVAVAIDNADATPLSQEEIAAIHVTPACIYSSDDERPASSYPLLDRRHYRLDPPTVLDLSGPIPLAIGMSLAVDEELQDCNDWEVLTRASATVPLPQDTPTRHLLPHGQVEGESSVPARKRKRKGSKKERARATEDTPQRHARKDDDEEDQDKRRPALGGMSGRRHSGFRVGHETFN